MRERRQPLVRKVCEGCGEGYEQSHVHPGTVHFYCSGKCRAKGYQEEHHRTDWLLLRVLEKAYRVIQQENLNFEIEVDMEQYPGRAGMRVEYLQFAEWVRRFAKQEGGEPAATEGKSEGNHEHP